MVKLGRFDIHFVVKSLTRVSAAPREGHLKRLVKILGYLQNATRRRKIILHSPEYIRGIIGKGDNTIDWL